MNPRDPSPQGALDGIHLGTHASLERSGLAEFAELAQIRPVQQGVRRIDVGHDSGSPGQEQELLRAETDGDLDAAVDRADAIAIIGTDDAGVEKHLGGRQSVIAARFVPVIEDDDLSGRPVVAFAGIGRPEKFFETLSGMGCPLVATRSFADHHVYSADEVMRLIDTATAAGAVAVTTEKDATRLPDAARDMVRTLRVTLEWRDSDALDTVLAPALQAKA